MSDTKTISEAAASVASSSISNKFATWGGFSAFGFSFTDIHLATIVALVVAISGLWFNWREDSRKQRKFEAEMKAMKAGGTD